MILWLIYFLFALAGIALLMSVIYMMKDGGQGTRNVKALTARVGICIVLFITLLIAIGTGKLVPSNSIKPLPTPTSEQQ